MIPAHLFALLATFDNPDDPDPQVIQRGPAPRTLPGTPPHPRQSTITDVPCPRCGAAVGRPCDRRTLGRHNHHKARVDLARSRR